MRHVFLAAFWFASAFADADIPKEIDRLDATLTKIAAAPLPDEVKGLVDVHRQSIERVRKAPSPEYALYRLRDAFIGVETIAFVAREIKAAESVESVEKLWKASRARFEAAAPRSRGTLLERALIENAQTRAERLFRASLPYAKASAPWSGIYYLGEAEANLRFRDYVLKTAAASSEKGPTLDRLVAVLDATERDTLAFFAGDVTNQGVIAVSVRLKEANEMLDAKRLDGATLLLVEARLALSRRGGPRPALPSEIAEASGSLRAALEAWADDEASPMKEKIRAEVIPFFASLLLPAPASKTPPASVTVTFVRWPYT
jgi:hypothetical protein